MAIQFHCPGCSQPIEVDDIHAGQAAACPYCRRVVSVPSESSVDPVRRVAARPTESEGVTHPPVPDHGQTEAPQPSPGELHIGPTMTPRERMARTLGTYALICGILAVLSFGAAVVYGLTLIAPEVLENSGTQLSEEQLSAIDEKLAGNRWMGAAQMGSMFFALVGAVLGVTSLVQSRRSNWRAVISVVVCGLLLTCACGGALLAAARGVGGGG
jgi:hypothetical protein